MKYIEANNINDRTRLVLLKYKQDRSNSDNKQIAALEAFYTDNGIYESAIVDRLKEIGCMDIENSSTDGYEDEFGHTKIEWGKLPHGNITTPQGIAMLPLLKRNSEKAKRWKSRTFTIFQLIGITIAAIGGLLKIIETICPLIFQ
ncbi:hypothetical protein [Segatella buccae]|uniref:hypothetical protein n=1 Tax=Segatella buccae TaxID=28126 RepID=UPI0022E4A7B9|nr:hypothetical protein [Segatella buccae]